MDEVFSLLGVIRSRTMISTCSMRMACSSAMDAEVSITKRRSTLVGPGTKISSVAVDCTEGVNARNGRS